MTFLADIFRDLANDPSWPWTLEPTVRGQDLHKTIIKYGEEQGEWFQVNHVDFAAWVAQSPLTMARLALMVVEREQQLICFGKLFTVCNHLEHLKEIFNIRGINPVTQAQPHHLYPTGIS